MVGRRTPDVPSKGFFLNQFWSTFYPQKKATEKHQKSFDPPVDQVLKRIGKPGRKHENENENEKSTFPIHTPIIIHTSVNMSEVVDLGPRSAAFGAKSLSPLLF